MVKPRILWNAKDAPWLNSGYGIISRYLLPRLADHYGYENVLVYAPVYVKEQVLQWEGLTVLGGTEFSFGENLVVQHYKEHRCNVLLQLGDAWPLGALPDAATRGDVLWVQWLPVDWLGMPKNIIHRISPAHKLIPFSEYGERALRKANFPNVGPKIWLGLDTNMWKPMHRGNFPRVMKSLGFSPHTFNILFVGANQERKHIRETLEAIDVFRKVNPGAKPRVYLHANLTGDRDLRADMDELGLAEICAWPDPYALAQGGYPEPHMVMIFNCADVVVNVAMEGFGFSQVQAQACGVPVICLSEGAGPELVKFGWEVPTFGKETTTYQMTQPRPDVAAMALCLEEAWKLRDKANGPPRNNHAVQWVRENLSWDRIVSQWVEVIDGVMEDRERYCLDIPERSPWLEGESKKLRELY